MAGGGGVVVPFTVTAMETDLLRSLTFTLVWPALTPVMVTVLLP